MMDMYTPIEEAQTELWARWNNAALREEVLRYIGDLPEVFVNEPRAVLFRNIMTPNFEYIHYLELAKKVNLKHLGLEYVTDSFCTRNVDKVSLGRLPFFKKKDRIGNNVIQYNRIIDMMGCERKPINEIKTLWGESLVDFHHRILSAHSSDIELFDISSWHKFNGNSAKYYYPYYLALFICNGILFENFITNEEEEERFSRTVVYPAFEEVVRLFGVKPLIVPLHNRDEVGGIYGNCYHHVLEQEVNSCHSLTINNE